MFRVLETAMSSTALLSVILIQGVCGTFFPPVSNAPPIPSLGIRLGNSRSQQLYVQEDLTPEVLQVGNTEGFFQRETKPDEPRWFIRESQSGESGDIQGSLEAFDRFYPEGEPAIGPVATPMPDDTYEAEPTSISRIKPGDAINSGTSDIWVLTRGSDNQITPERWVQIQVPSERVVDVVNQESGPVLATDTVKSIAAPTPLTGPLKSQVISGKSPNIVQQVWVQATDISGPQKGYADPTTIVEEVPSIKQIVQIPTANAELFTPQVTKNAYAVQPPPPPAVISKTNFAAAPPALLSSDFASKSSFIAPPPPPPLLKGGEVSPKVISSAPVGIAPNTNFLTSGKSGLMQPIRHIWIPTSARTGKFISIPISSALNSGKSVVSKGSPLEPQPIAVSDTWVLKQNGPVPSFEQQKSVIPPSVVNNKILIQDPQVLQVDAIPAQPVITEIASPKNLPVIDKGNPTVQVDIWPPRNDIKTKTYDKSTGVITSNIPPQPLAKTDSVVLGKSGPFPPPTPQKTILTSPKAAPLPLPIPAPAVQIVNGKPCPLPLPSPQKSVFPASPPQFYSAPRVIGTQNKAPLTRIVRVNRYPTGSYYLLNSKIRPSVFNYPRPAFVQARPQFIRLVQNKQIPVQVKNVVSFPPVQTKQISIPVKSKSIPAPIPARQVIFPFSGRQIILPLSQLKSQNRLIYPGVQNIRYAYPWNPLLKASPVPGKRGVLPPSNPIKKIAPITKISSSSSESSSESSSSESSSESSEEEKKEEKSKEEEKPQNEESSESAEKESEKEESESKSSESKEEASESQSKENIETEESQAVATYENLPILSNRGDQIRSVSHPYFFRFDNRDRNGTTQHRQETSDVEGRVTGTYSFIDPTGLFRRANYVADSDGFRVKLESNEPGTITHESANANFISNQVTAEEGVQRYETGESTNSYSTFGTQRD